MGNQKRRSDCPISFALELFGDKWTFLIVRDIMFKGKRSYGEFLRSDEKIATNILADRLTQLEHAKIVIKKPDPAHGSKFIYQLTPKGIELMPILIEIICWSARYDEHTAAEAAFIKDVETDKAGLIKGLTKDLLNEIQ